MYNRSEQMNTGLAWASGDGKDRRQGQRCGGVCETVRARPGQISSFLHLLHDEAEREGPLRWGHRGLCGIGDAVVQLNRRFVNGEGWVDEGEGLVSLEWKWMRQGRPRWSWAVVDWEHRGATRAAGWIDFMV
ncbi:hypothetical protein M0R45_001178 [Rubus argutus]|uniref:MHC class I antigen n=1 Tax=Rubus argutus TaxID=59490 RepID=A0AAW1VNM7_RUBAR